MERVQKNDIPHFRQLPGFRFSGIIKDQIVSVSVWAINYYPLFNIFPAAETAQVSLCFVIYMESIKIRYIPSFLTCILHV